MRQHSWPLGSANWQLCSTQVVREAASGSCGLRTVNLCSQITSEYVSVVRECPTKVSHKSVLQECPARVCHIVTKMSHESVPQERSRSVSPKRMSKDVWAFVFERMFAFGFVGSILFGTTNPFSFVSRGLAGLPVPGGAFTAPVAAVS